MHRIIAKLRPSSSFSWVELALFLMSPTAYPSPPPLHILRHLHHISCAPTTRTKSEIAGNEQNWLFNINSKAEKNGQFLKNGR
jgi:hypothetical protein